MLHKTQIENVLVRAPVLRGCEACRDGTAKPRTGNSWQPEGADTEEPADRESTTLAIRRATNSSINARLQ